MRFKSSKVGGITVFAVTGVNTVSFGIVATQAARKGLLGFAVEREDKVENEKYWMFGYKVFKSVIPNPDETTQVTTYDHPVQSFVWDDFTAKDGRKYTYRFLPVRGTPKNLDRSAASIPITIETEKLFTTGVHDVFFNRGVASSQAYAHRFKNKKPSQLKPQAKQDEALEWLSRKLDDALLKFIRQAKKGDGLLGCFYEFRYRPVADELKAAIVRGVDVRLVIDGKINETIDKNGKKHESFPRIENMDVVKAAKIPDSRVSWREAKPNDIQHNKFMVLLKGKKRTPTEVWTGSTNLSDGGIHGQTNVGHWVRDGATARQFAAYWQVLEPDPGGREEDDASTKRKKNDQLRKDVEAASVTPATLAAIPPGISCVFSPRKGLGALELYYELLDTAPNVACITLAFGINKDFKKRLSDNSPLSALTYVLLEKEDKAKKNSTQPFLFIGAKQNVYKAWGSFLRLPVYQWIKETNAGILGFNKHVSYVHSKFLLRDPLGADPIVVTGSANFSDASTTSNDENMLIIRGDRRVADIYFTEFNRIFGHYYFRSVVEATTRRGDNSPESMFLKEKPQEWLAPYAKAGSYKSKRLAAYAQMSIS